MVHSEIDSVFKIPPMTNQPQLTPLRWDTKPEKDADEIDSIAKHCGMIQRSLPSTSVGKQQFSTRSYALFFRMARGYYVSETNKLRFWNEMNSPPKHHT